MAKKENKEAKVAKETKAKATAKKAVSAEEKAAKRAARMEALKNRPAEQRPNSKQIDIIVSENGACIKSYGYPIKAKNVHIGVMVTTVAYDKAGNIISTSVTFVPGDLTVKSKKNHGVICAAKHKGEPVEEEVETQDED